MVLGGIPLCHFDRGQQMLSQATSGPCSGISAVYGSFPLGGLLVGTLFKDKGAELCKWRLSHDHRVAEGTQAHLVSGACGGQAAVVL